MEKAGNKLLAAADTQTRGAERDRRRSMAAVGGEGGDAEGGAGKKGRRGSMSKSEAAAEAALSNTKILQIDLDAKMDVLARNLRLRKQAFVFRLLPAQPCLQAHLPDTPLACNPTCLQPHLPAWQDA